MLFLRLKAWFYVQYTIPPPAAMLGLLSLDPGGIQTATQSQPGARPTKHISIEFEIRWKFKTL